MLGPIAAAYLACVAIGCGGQPPAPPPQPGTVFLTWTVGKASTSTACQAVQAATVHVVLNDWEGHPAGEWTEDCSHFAATVAGLDPDEYSGRAELLEANGSACMPSVDLGEITVVGSSSVTLAIDFSAASTSP
jgi:hypothetical protein